MTAHAAVYRDGPVEGQTILVTGAAGAVGNYAVQMAHNGGATVIGTVSSDEKAARAREDGATYTINYKTEDVAERVLELTGGKGVDRVVEVELGGNIGVTAKVLKTGAVIAAYASMAEPVVPFPFYPVLMKSPTLHIIGCFTMPEAFKQQSVADISRWMAEGNWTNRVAAEFPLEEIGQAHVMVEDGRQVGTVGGDPVAGLTGWPSIVRRGRLLVEANTALRIEQVAVLRLELKVSLSGRHGTRGPVL